KSKPQTVVLKNIDSSTLKINGITIAGSNPKSFGETNNCGTSLPAGASCRIHVSFRPKTIGNLTALVQVSYQGFGGPQFVTLSGTGVQVASVSLTPAKMTFPTQVIGT